MIYSVYAIRDSKTGFLTPTIDINDASAMRNFEHACMQTNSLFFSHSQAYDLYRIARFNSDTGEISDNNLDLICSGSSISKEV